MRYVSAVVVAAMAAMCVVGRADAAAAFVQKAVANQAAATTVSIVLNGVAAGNLIACATTSFDATDTLASLTDGTNTYTSVDTFAGLGLSIETRYAKNVAAGNFTLTATWANSGTHELGCHEVSGLQTAAPLDQHSANQYGGDACDGSDFTAIGPVTTTTDGQYIYVATAHNNGKVMSAGTGYTAENSLADFWLDEQRVQASQGSIAGTVSCVGGGTENGLAGIMTFKAAGSSGFRARGRAL